MKVEWTQFATLFLAIVAAAVGSHYVLAYLASRSTAQSAPAVEAAPQALTAADFIRQKYGEVVGV